MNMGYFLVLNGSHHFVLTKTRLCVLSFLYIYYIYIYRSTKEETVMMMMMMSTTKEEKKKKKKKTKVSATTTKKKMETFFPTSPRVRVVLRKTGASGRDRNAN